MKLTFIYKKLQRLSQKHVFIGLFSNEYLGIVVEDMD